MKRIYQRHSYAAEMATAWHLLGEHLTMLTSVKTDSTPTLALTVPETST